MNSRACFLLVPGMLLSACTYSPQKPEETANSALMTPASEPVKSNYSADELDKRARQMGYRIVMRNNEKRYCQYGASVGSHIAQIHCLNPDMMSQAARDEQEMQNKLLLRGNQLCPSCIQKDTR